MTLKRFVSMQERNSFRFLCLHCVQGLTTVQVRFEVLSSTAAFGPDLGFPAEFSVHSSEVASDALTGVFVWCDGSAA